MHDKELGTGRIRMRSSCHRQHTRCMAKIVLESILAKFTLDGVSRTAHTCTVPVSYTHLDVYKRQALDTPLEDPALLGLINTG